MLTYLPKLEENVKCFATYFQKTVPYQGKLTFLLSFTKQEMEYLVCSTSLSRFTKEQKPFYNYEMVGDILIS